VVLQDGPQQARRFSVHTPFDTVPCLKSPYFS
jgi:hypothetical protein